MPISFSCPCGQPLQAPDKIQGKKIKCPGCGKTLTVPGTAAQAAVPSPVIGFAAEADRVCPECQKKLPAAALVCTGCGFNFKTGKKVGAKPDFDEDVLTCPTCDGVLEPGQTECPYCKTAAAAFAKADQEEALKEAKAPTKRGRDRLKRPGQEGKRVVLQRTAAPASKLPDPAELGKHIGTYRIRMGHYVLTMVLGPLAILVGLGLFVLSWRIDVVRETETTVYYDPKVRVFKFILMGAGLAIAGGGSRAVYKAQASRGLVIEHYVKGLVEIRGEEVEVYPWNQIVRFEEELTKKTMEHGALAMPYQVTIERADGRVLVVDGATKGVSFLGSCIKKEFGKA